jgi:RHS repeat-associated protein
VRFLTKKDGVITDTYTYDSFGILISSTGVTPNNYLYNGQQFDSHLGIYFKRARYYNQDRGRFMTMDPYWGELQKPQTLHKYMFGHADPVNHMDPCGTTTMTMEYPVSLLIINALLIWTLRALAAAIVCLFMRIVTRLIPLISFAVPPGLGACADDPCKEPFQECLGTFQPPWNRDFGVKKPCLDCYFECQHADGVWPDYKCPR